MARGQGDSWFDATVAFLAGAGLLLVCGGCLFRADWVVPPIEGAGPYRTDERVHDARVLLVVLGVAVLLLAARGLYAESAAAWCGAGALGLIVLVFWVAPALPHDEAQILGDGFGDSWYSTNTDSKFVFYNTTAAPVTICLGISGDCDSAAKGPGRLRSPGLTVPANHRLAVDTPWDAGDFKLTLVGAGFARRDAVLHTADPPPSSW